MIFQIRREERRENKSPIPIWIKKNKYFSSNLQQQKSRQQQQQKKK